MFDIFDPPPLGGSKYYVNKNHSISSLTLWCLVSTEHIINKLADES